jgi:phosphohistidine phosphatase
MRRLVLVRHAKSSWKEPALADHERPLNARGRDDALRIGAHLAHEGLRVDEVLCSSALRARATWKRIASRWPAAPAARIVPELYLPTLRGLEAALATARADSETVLVVGHSPSLDAFVLSHAGGGPLPQRLAEGLPTGSVTVLELDVASFAEIAGARGRISAFVTPRELGASHPARSEGPIRGERIELTPTMRVRELASLALGSALAQLRGNARGAQASEDPGFAHQQRVGVRKLRVYLRSFDKLVGAARARHLIDELRWLFRLLGALREHDVLFASEPGTHIARSQTAALRALARALDARRSQHQRALQNALSSRRYADLVRDLLALEAELAHGERPGHKRATSWLEERLGHRLARAQASARGLELGDADATHALRKELKKLRYVAELARGAFGRRRVHRFLEALGALQDALGSWNDAMAGAALIEHALRDLPAAQRTAARRELGELEPAADELEPWLERVRKLEPFWT